MKSNRHERLKKCIEDMEKKGIIMPKNRDPKRIKRILVMIAKIWEKYPQLRLGQLIGNCFNSSDDLFYVEDSKLEEGLKETYENVFKG